MAGDRGGSKPKRQELKARAAAVKLLVLDVDGVLTDGGLYYGPGGEAMKRFDVRDGHGLVMARLCGLPSAVLTARTSAIVEVRGRELGMVAVAQGQKDKRAGLIELCRRVNVAPHDCAFMGDDLNDIGPLAMVGLPACPADAAPEVRRASLFVSRSPGGRGAVRELVEFCLKSSHRWERAMNLMVSANPAPAGPKV